MLGGFARDKMRREMDWSFAYDFNPSDHQAILQKHCSSNDRMIRRSQQEFVVVMVGHSYFCTCLLLQNTGIVDSRCKYRISLVLKRWFKEQWQDLEDFEIKVGSELLVAYPHHSASIRTEDHPTRTEDHLASTRTRIVHTLFSTESSASQPRKEERLRKKRYADVAGIRCKRSTTSQSR
ncbi:hypothetical protein BC939DRAFT_470583 [Gamsiella multidivaricata]|uniref:uncharacterized protein n=1 Tax=Gamsiella multidivaricata TaxID=101098 RepID=UPI00221EE207|nr:uncharacterized protein BC939DRAFT_470583 [Gamsiella multidivaricata]KAI7816050.1 hypothetical protein BC939DRAFT_470583 [Gamsiella multidivaricata]